MPASSLRALCGVERREARSGTRRSTDLRIQRSHDKERSEEISRYVKYGFPYSSLRGTRMKSGKFEDLKQPGWLPTAIVVNIGTAEQTIGGKIVDPRDLVNVIDAEDGSARIELPLSGNNAKWKATDLEPMEVIDGQHRLFLEPGQEETDFELPVVAFLGLDRSWQAYLFWTINIKPKKINASLAYDLYPMLRNQGLARRNLRADRLSRDPRAGAHRDALGLTPIALGDAASALLGEAGDRDVRQAAWVRALIHTYIKASEGRRIAA